MNDYSITLYSKIGDVEHIIGPFRRRAKTTGAAIAAEMRYGAWDADIVQVRAERVSTLGQAAFLEEHARG